MTTRVARYCLCGGSLVGTGRPGEYVAGLVSMWLELHAGPGCGPATQQQAAAARRRTKREASCSER